MVIPAGRNLREAPSAYAGIELGGTKCICILANGPDDVIALERIPTEQPQPTLKAASDVIAGWHSEYSIPAIGIASFGPLDLDAQSSKFGSLTTTPKPGWSGVDLTGLAFSAACSIDTDVNAAALAEGLWGAAVGMKSWCYITLGTGVGVASIVAGNPVSGLGHSEAGHMRVPVPQGCFGGSCPYHGDCVEGLVSGPALSVATGMDSTEIPDDHPIWGKVAAVLASMCHNLLFTTVPQVIIFGGGVTDKRPFLIDLIRIRLAKSVAGYAYAELISHDLERFLVPARLGSMAGPLGAIALAMRNSAQLP